MEEFQLLSAEDPLARTQFTLRCRLSADDLVAGFGAPHFPDQEGFGLGDYDGWGFAFSCGLKVFVTALPWATEDGGKAAAGEPIDVWFQSTVLDPDHIRSHFTFLPALERCWGKTDSFPSPTWVVWRQDDNGIVDKVAVATSHCEADKIREQLDSKGHKQMYWLEQRCELAHPSPQPVEEDGPVPDAARRVTCVH